MKEKIILILLILMCNSMFGQPLLFQEVDVREMKMNDKDRIAYEKLSKADHVTDFSVIRINTTQFQASESLSLTHKQFSTVTNLLEIDVRDNSNFTWFGTLDDGTGIFFTVLGDKVFSKFYMGDVPYSIVPLSGGYHMLVGFDKQVMEGQCLHETDKHEVLEKSPEHHHNNKKERKGSKNALVDDICNLRILIVFTDDADAVMDMQVIGQGMVDESNLAYIMSDIDVRMELARTVAVNYNQLNTSSSQSIYAYSNISVQNDLINIRNGANGFETMPALRDAYKADVVALVREGGLGGNDTFWGQAYGIPTDNLDPTGNNAFVLVGNTSSTTLIAGRFSFAHEIGHVQGARHNTHNDIPEYARGHVYGAGAGADRTILSTQGSTCSNTNTGCRVNYFSNPDVTVGGVPVGTTDRDNARMIDETSIIMKNHRVTDLDLTISGETFEDEIIANHLAHYTITTSGNVNAENGTRVTMRAGGAVCLTTGFEAQAGSVFTAYTAAIPCDNIPLNLTQENQENVEETTLKNSAHTTDLEIAEYKSMTVKNYPNPFTGQTTIAFDLPKDTEVTLFVSDMTGKQITRLLEHQPTLKGTHQVIFDGTAYPAGMYYYTIQAGNEVVTQKMMLMK